MVKIKAVVIILKILVIFTLNHINYPLIRQKKYICDFICSETFGGIAFMAPLLQT